MLMKLQNRIIIGFLMVVLVPVLLLMATLYGFGQIQAGHGGDAQMPESSYDISIEGSNESTARVRLMTKDV